MLTPGDDSVRMNKKRPAPKRGMLSASPSTAIIEVLSEAPQDVGSMTYSSVTHEVGRRLSFDSSLHLTANYRIPPMPTPNPEPAKEEVSSRPSSPREVTATEAESLQIPIQNPNPAAASRPQPSTSDLLHAIESLEERLSLMHQEIRDIREEKSPQGTMKNPITSPYFPSLQIHPHARKRMNHHSEKDDGKRSPCETDIDFCRSQSSVSGNRRGSKVSDLLSMRTGSLRKRRFYPPSLSETSRLDGGDTARKYKAPEPPPLRTEVVEQQFTRVESDNSVNTLAHTEENEWEEEVGPLVFLPDSAYRITWDIVYHIFCLWEICTFLLAMFTLEGGEVTVNPPQIGLRIVVTVFWLVDILVQCRTCVLRDWEIDEDPDSLWQRYKRSFLPIDILASLPFDLCALAGGTTLFFFVSSSRCLRILHIPWLFQPSTPVKMKPIYVEAVQFLFWVALLTHLITCIWIAVATPEEQTVQGDDPYAMYTSGLYFIMSTISSVGYGDIIPKSTSMKVYIMIVQVLGVCLIIAVSGRTGALFITTDPFKLLVLERRRRLESLMTHNRIPWHTQKEAFTIYPVLLEASVRDYQPILHELPDFLQEKIGTHIKTRLLRNVPMFKDIPQESICILASVLSEEYCGAREYLIRAGEVGQEMYFLNHGVVEVLLPGEKGQEVWTANLKSGSWFGEIALLHRTTRIASIRSLTGCVLYKLDKPDFDQVVRRSEALRNAMAAETARRVQMTRDIAEKRASKLTRFNSQPVLSSRPSGISKILKKVKKALAPKSPPPSNPSSPKRPRPPPAPSLEDVHAPLRDDVTAFAASVRARASRGNIMADMQQMRKEGEDRRGNDGPPSPVRHESSSMPVMEMDHLSEVEEEILSKPTEAMVVQGPNVGRHHVNRHPLSPDSTDTLPVSNARSQPDEPT